MIFSKSEDLVGSNGFSKCFFLWRHPDIVFLNVAEDDNFVQIVCFVEMDSLKKSTSTLIWSIWLMQTFTYNC